MEAFLIWLITFVKLSLYVAFREKPWILRLPWWRVVGQAEFCATSAPNTTLTPL